MQSDDLPVDFYKEFDALVKHVTKGAAKRKQSSVAELDENERELERDSENENLNKRWQFVEHNHFIYWFPDLRAKLYTRKTRLDKAQYALVLGRDGVWGLFPVVTIRAVAIPEEYSEYNCDGHVRVLDLRGIRMLWSTKREAFLEPSGHFIARSPSCLKVPTASNPRTSIVRSRRSSVSITSSLCRRFPSC